MRCRRAPVRQAGEYLISRNPALHAGGYGVIRLAVGQFMQFKNKQLLLILAFAPVLFCSCRAFGNFWDNNKEEKTTYSDPSDSVAPTMPPAPSGVSGGSTQLNLSWTAASDNVNQPSALIYEICQSLAAGGCNTFSVTFVTAAGATSFNATGLNPSTTYYYRVRAKDTAGNAGPETAEFSATTAAAGTVNTPTYSPVAGAYSSNQNVNISTSTGGAILCYTNDGITTPACNAVPVCTVGTTYAAAVSVTTTTTLKAIACKNGSIDSAVANGVFTIDTTPPTVSNVTSSTSNGTLGVGQTISIQVTFSEPVNVTGAPQLTLATGSPATTVVNYVSGTGTATLNFDYVTVSGNFSTDLDYASTGALALNGGSIQDAAGNAATLTLAGPGATNSLGFNKNLIIDGVGPTVTGVTASTANGTYTVANVITIQVSFNETVTVTGSPQLTLATGSPPTTAVNYSAGSGSTTLVFNYSVAAGNSSADLDYLNAAALALNGGTINDASGNAAALTLAPPGAVGSIANSKNIVIDTGGLTPGTALSFSAVGTTGLTLNWGAATDDITPQVGLQYKVVKDNTALTNIDTVVEANAKTAPDLLQDWAASIVTLPVTGLTAGTTYHFAVLVRDGAGNMALYTPASQATSGGGLPRRFLVTGGSTTVTTIYNSGTHTFTSGPVMSVGTAGAGGHSFPLTSGTYNGRIFIIHGNAGMLTSIYDPVGNSFIAGAPLLTNSGAGSNSFPITSGLHAGQTFFVRGQAGVYNTYLYDHGANSFTQFTSVVSYASVAGSHNFLTPSGKTVVVHGGSRYSGLYTPHATTPTYTAGTDMDAALTVAAGGHTFAVNSGTYSGKFIVVRAGGTTGVFLYDPGGNTFSTGGPALSASAGDGAHAFEITAGPNAGQILVIHGGATNTTSLFNPSLGTFSAGPTLSANAGACAHAFQISGGTHSSKMVVVHGNSTLTTSMLEPGPAPSFGFVSGPPLSANAGTGCHSFVIP